MTMTKNTSIGSKEHFRRMPAGNPRRSLGVAISAERQLAALNIIHEGYAFEGQTITANPLSAVRASLNAPAGNLSDGLADIMQDNMLSLDSLDYNEMTSSEIEILSEAIVDSQVQSLWTQEVAGAPRHLAPGRRRPKVLELKKIIPPDPRSAAPLLAPFIPAANNDPFEVDLMALGILLHYGIDPKVVAAELEALSKLSTVILASPSARSNHAITLQSLGPNFPPALFDLRGRSLDMKRLVLDGRDGDGNEVLWEWHPRDPRYKHGPIIETPHMMTGLDLYRCERRSLAAVLGDQRIHPSIRIASAGRSTSEGKITTVTIELHRRSVPLVPIRDISEARLAAPARITPMQVWMEPEGYLIEDACKKLVKKLSSNPQGYDFYAEVQDNYILLTLSRYNVPGRAEQMPRLVGENYQLFQSDFASLKNLNAAIDRIFGDHVINTLSNEDKAEQRKLEERAENAQLRALQKADTQKAARARAEIRQKQAEEGLAKLYAQKSQSTVFDEVKLQRAIAINRVINPKTDAEISKAIEYIEMADYQISYGNLPFADADSNLRQHVCLYKCLIIDALAKPWLARVADGRCSILQDEQTAYLDEMDADQLYYRHKRFELSGDNKDSTVGMLIVKSTDICTPFAQIDPDALVGKKLKDVLLHIQTNDIVITKASREGDVLYLGIRAPVQQRWSRSHNDDEEKWDELSRQF